MVFAPDITVKRKEMKHYLLLVLAISLNTSALSGQNNFSAMLAGVSTQEIATTVQTAVRGAEASKYRVGEDEYDITVRLAEEDRSSLDALQNFSVFNRWTSYPVCPVSPGNHPGRV